MLTEGPHLQGAHKQHKLIVTLGGNKRFRVRCKCMAEYRNVSDRYYNYDTLTDEAYTVDDIVRAYREHLEAA